jgi:DNA mismatch endonuclease, patch repair protein
VDEVQRRSPEAVSAIMRRVKSTDSAAEVLLRRELHRRGFRFRLHARDLPGKPDLVFRSRRVVVFIDGDFWHGRQWITRGLPSLSAQFHSNRSYWVTKISRTVQRDRHVNAELERLGWTVIRVWESDILRNPAVCADHVAGSLSVHQR